MATPNRGTRITKLLGQVKKHFKPVSSPKDRTLVEHLLFACLLENSPHEVAESVFETLQKQYFDWNEVRVSTKRELSETLKGLVDPDRSAERLKRALHSVFESVYAYDLEPLKKQNLGQAAKQIAKYGGTTPFTVAYVTQNALGGHAIPANQGLLIAFHVFDLISEAEMAKSLVPGLERAVTKSKGVEVASVLHQLGVEIGKNPYGAPARKLLQAIDPSCKPRLPKKPEPPPPAKKKSKEKPTKKGAAKAPAKKSKAKSPAKAAKPKKKATTKKVKKKVAKKPTKGTAAKKKKKAKTGKKITKRKPK